MSHIDNLALKAEQLARSSPREWEEFLVELEQYTEHFRNACIQSAPEGILVFQGRAQALSSLLVNLRKCKETADKISRKQNT